ncbi:MAG: glycine--tRNA ligase subunit beta [Firmicutes bacterium]|nr:glycine--tRNA ligase subunit beta [Bacillota bacterium]MDH7496107.1 glycine--tRNA ligase subunit beta [Bacillota bacterium]
MNDAPVLHGRRDAVLEIGAEEIPARFLPEALRYIEREGARILTEERVDYEDVRALGTPRRLVLYVEGVAPLGPPLVRETRGPAYSAAFDASGNPTRAAEGFARSRGVRVEDLVIKDEPKGRFVYAVSREDGRPAQDALASAFTRLIAGMSFPKSMRWGDLDFRFARPIRWVLALLGEQVVPLEVGGIGSGRLTAGHRFLTRGMLEVAKAEDYIATLRAAHCLADHRERREVIARGASEAAKSLGGRIVEDEDLLEELTFLSEHPVPLVGRFDPDLLRLPREVIVTPMRDHQRYFPVEDERGRLLPAFVAVRDGLASRIDAVRRGNERVLAARLQDARFFYEEDTKAHLETYIDGLSGVVFHEQLGTMLDKARRVERLAADICVRLGLSEGVSKVVTRAAQLCKADLVTHMVKEFPELQGVMGAEYAMASGEDSDVARAISEHYMPRFAGDRLPESRAGIVLSLADKMDTVAGFYGIGIQPSGSEDPYALRRQVSGIVSILLERDVDVPVYWLASRSVFLLEQAGVLRLPPEEVSEAILDSTRQRMRATLIDRGIRYDLVDAVLGAGFDDVPDTLRRAEALASASGTEEFGRAVTGYTRASRIAGSEDRGEVDESLLGEPAERRLFVAFCEAREVVAAAVKRKDYASALKAMAELADPIDAFFRDVLVMTEDEARRHNRLALLSRVAGLSRGIADFSKVVQTETT